MLYLGIDQHARQITISLRDEDGDVIQARQVSTRPEKIIEYFGLLRLRDGAGKALGDAVVYAEPNTGGRVLSVWFRLLEGPHAEELLHDVFAFAAGQK